RFPGRDLSVSTVGTARAHTCAMLSAAWVRIWTSVAVIGLSAATSSAMQAPSAPPAPRDTAAQGTQAQVTGTCASKAGDRTECAADTSAGVILVRSTGSAACLLGKTWGYDQKSVWVSDGGTADLAGASTVEGGL